MRVVQIDQIQLRVALYPLTWGSTNASSCESAHSLRRGDLTNDYRRGYEAVTIHKQCYLQGLKSARSV